MKKSKNYTNQSAKIDREKKYSPKEALIKIKEIAAAKFDETVEVHFFLGIDPKQADQQLRGTMTLPKGTGQKKRIVAICKQGEADKAKDAGAIDAGDVDVIERIQKGWFDFDILLTSPDMMGKIGRLGRTLGSKGLMPNLKSGTIVKDVVTAVKEFSKGKVEFRNDKYGIIHISIGKVSFSEENLLENFEAVYDLLSKEKPSKSKGVYMKSISVASTMGPGVWIEPMKIKWGEK